MSGNRLWTLALALLLAVNIAGCRGVGKNGGTVKGPDGAQVVIPAGALTRNVTIAVTQTSQGAPALPEGLSTAGPMYAFTPHGTTFALPVTITIPFDPAQVPAGATPQLFKTTAGQTGWEQVTSATVNGATMTAGISSFSYAVVVVPPAPEPEPAMVPPHRIWELATLSFHYSGPDWHTVYDRAVIENGESFAGIVDEYRDLGDLIVAPNGYDLDAEVQVYSNESGETYWAESEAPIGTAALGEPNGSEAKLFQRQYYRKESADASLRFVVSQVRIHAWDSNGDTYGEPCHAFRDDWSRSRCIIDRMYARLGLTMSLISLPSGELLRAYNSQVELAGTRGVWDASISMPPVSRQYYENGSLELKTLWARPTITWRQVDFEEIAGSDPGARALLYSVEPFTVSIDLSDVPVGGEFVVDTELVAYTINARGRESYLGAYLRDPSSSDGLTTVATGLRTIEPVPFTPVPPADPSCDGGGVASGSGTLQFSAANYDLLEGRPYLNSVRVTRSGGTAGAMLARVVTVPRSAQPGTHFEPVEQLVHFHDGDDTDRSVKIPVVNDTVQGGMHDLDVRLEAVGNCANIGNPATARVTLVDDDVPPPTTYTVGGNVSGLAGTGLVLREIITGREVTPAADGAFTFDYQFQSGGSYEVRVQAQPVNPLQVCTGFNLSGTIAGANVTNVSVTCITPAAGGSLDPGYGSSGKFSAVLSGGAKAMTLQPDGRALLLGDRRLMRVNVDGTADATFGTAGAVDISLGGSAQDTARSVVVQPDGRILVAGSTRNIGTTMDDFAVTRLNGDGSVDTTFGTNGVTEVDFESLPDTGSEVLLQSDGRIVVTGTASSEPTPGLGWAGDYAAIRLTSGGQLDPTFGSGGRTRVNLAGYTDIANAAALAPDGSIVIVGRAADDGGDPPDVGVVKLTPDGARDPSFRGGGFFVHDFANGDRDEAKDVVVQPDGRIVIVGYLVGDSGSDYLAARLHADGERDTTFGGGAAVIAMSTGNDMAEGVALAADGDVIVVGSSPSTTVSDFGIARLSSAGLPDTAFDGDGLLYVDFFAAADGAHAVEVQDDGKILVSGNARNGSAVGLGVARINP
jgi:uncharacterized delta-60 repeat protein